jgi:hypothetical protein
MEPEISPLKDPHEFSHKGFKVEYDFLKGIVPVRGIMGLSDK